MIKPVNGCLLVELVDQYEFASTPETQFATKTSGIVRAQANKDGLYLNKRIWFKSYEDDIKIDIDGKPHTLIELEKIRGYEDE